jgi:hypothetical protein
MLPGSGTRKHARKKGTGRAYYERDLHCNEYSTAWRLWQAETRLFSAETWAVEKFCQGTQLLPQPASSHRIH